MAGGLVTGGRKKEKGKEEGEEREMWQMAGVLVFHFSAFPFVHVRVLGPSVAFLRGRTAFPDFAQLNDRPGRKHHVNGAARRTVSHQQLQPSSILRTIKGSYRGHGRAHPGRPPSACRPSPYSR